MISNIVSKERYMVLSPTPIGSGYSIPFMYWDRAQISAIITDDSGAETTVSTSDYSVSSPGDTGTLTFDLQYQFPAGTEILTIVRSVEIEQQTDYRNGDVLDAEVLERSLDMVVAMVQEMNEKLNRTVRIPISDPVSVLQMPSALIRKDMLLGFDGSGNIIPILTSDIEQKLAQALAAENSVLGMYSDPGMAAVRIDMADPSTSNIQKVAANKNNIDTVAASITNVNKVGSNIVKVVSVADNETRINAVFDNESNINAVNANKTNIDIVAGNKTNIDIVAGNTSNINAVVSNTSNITTVATDLSLGGASAVKVVAANIAIVQAVHNNKTNIDAVAGNKTNIDAVKTNEANINTVATDLGLGNASNIKIVAASISNVNAVGSNIVKVTDVEKKLNEITTVHTNIDAVNTAATNMAAIIAAPSEASAAASARGQAEAARDKARKWAEEVEDTEVETNQYSAFHWAEKSHASAQAAMAADAAANKQIMYEGTLYQYSLKQAARPGHIAISFEEVI